MTKKTINTGINPNDGSGDTLREAMGKINQNFDDLYTTQTSFLIDAPIDSSGYVRFNAEWIRLDSAGLVFDALSNGTLYARRDNDWVAIPSNLEAPIDGNAYGRLSQSWVRTVREADSDGSLYVRQNGDWTVLPPSVPEAPNNGTSYVRQNEGWVSLTGTIGVTEADNNGQIFARQNEAWLDITSTLEAAGLSEAPSDGNYYLRFNGNWSELDSAALTSAVGSVWETPASGGGASSGVDSAAVTALIDSDYVQARQIVGGASNLGSITDVSLGIVSDGQSLVFDANSGNWINSSSGGGGASNLGGLSDVSLGLVSGGQVLAFDPFSGNWVNSFANLMDLNDVSLGLVADGQALVYDGNSGNWINSTISGGSSTFGSLTDVSLGLVSDGQTIVFDANSGNWINSSSGGGASNLASITDVSLGIVSDGQALVFDANSGNWVNSAISGGAGGIDSAATIALIDSDYVAARAPSGGGASLVTPLTSQTVKLSTPLSPGDVPIVSVSKAIAAENISNTDFTPRAITAFDKSDYSSGSFVITGAAFDTNTFALDSASFDYTIADSASTNMHIREDGTLMYVADSDGVVYKYSLSTPFDVSTASLDSSRDFSTLNAISNLWLPLKSISLSPDGRSIFLTGGASTTTSNSYGIQLRNSNGNEWTLSNATSAPADTVQFFGLTVRYRDMCWGDNGLKLFYCSETTGIVNAFQSGFLVPYSFGGAGYLAQYNASAQDTSMVGIAFNPIGTVMALLGGTTNNIYFYNLSTAWDVATSSYSGESYSLDSADTDSFVLHSNTNGIGFYHMGGTNQRIYQYASGSEQKQAQFGRAITTADINRLVEVPSTGGAAYITDSDGTLNVIRHIPEETFIEAGEWTLSDVQFDADKESFALSNSPGPLYDILNLSYTGNVFDHSAQDFDAYDLEFNSEGTLLFVLGSSGNIHKYSLSSPFDITNPTFVETKDVSAIINDNNWFTFQFSPDGRKLFFGTGSENVYECVMSFAYDISSLQYTGVSYDFSNEESQLNAIFIGNNGTKMFIAGAGNDLIYQHTLSTPWDLTTISYDQVSFSIVSQEQAIADVNFLPDGLTMFISGSSSDRFHEYNLGTAWDISTASYNSVSSPQINSQEGTVTGNFFTPDGKRVLTTGRLSDSIHEYSVQQTNSVTGDYAVIISSDVRQVDTTTWTDINSFEVEGTAGDGEANFAFSNDNKSTWYVGFENEPLRRIIRNNGGTLEYNDTEVFTPYKIGNSVFEKSLNLDSSQDFIVDVKIRSDDGSSLYIADYGTDGITQYSFNDSDVDSLTQIGFFSVTGQIGTIWGLDISPDGTKMYAIASNDEIYQYTMSTPWDITTCSYDSLSFDTTSQDTNMKGFRFSADGTKLYTVGSTNDRVFEYNLSTAWNISTASYNSVNYALSNSLAGIDNFPTPQGLTIKPDGTAIYVIAEGSSTVSEILLSTPWDLSTATPGVVKFVGQSFDYYGLDFNSSGSKLFLVELNFPCEIYQYTSQDFGYTDSENWVAGADFVLSNVFKEAMNASSANRMSPSQFNAVNTSGKITNNGTLDLAVAFKVENATDTPPSFSRVSTFYDGSGYGLAVPGVDYTWTEVSSDTVRVDYTTGLTVKIRIT